MLSRGEYGQEKEKPLPGRRWTIPRWHTIETMSQVAVLMGDREWVERERVFLCLLRSDLGSGKLTWQTLQVS